MSTVASLITGVSVVYSTVSSGADQKKHQSSASLAFVRGIHLWPVNSPHKRPVTRKMCPFDDVIHPDLKESGSLELWVSIYPLVLVFGRYQAIMQTNVDISPIWPYRKRLNINSAKLTRCYSNKCSRRVVCGLTPLWRRKKWGGKFAVSYQHQLTRSKPVWRDPMNCTEPAKMTYAGMVVFFQLCIILNSYEQNSPKFWWNWMIFLNHNVWE